MLGKWSYVAVDLGGGRMTEGLRDSHRTDQVPEGPCSVEVSPRRWGRVSPKVQGRMGGPGLREVHHPLSDIYCFKRYYTTEHLKGQFRRFEVECHEQ